MLLSSVEFFGRVSASGGLDNGADSFTESFLAPSRWTPCCGSPYTDEAEVVRTIPQSLFSEKR